MLRIRLPNYRPETNLPRLLYDLELKKNDQYHEFWKRWKTSEIPKDLLEKYPVRHLEIGPGGGKFLASIAKRNPNELYVGIERNKHRAEKLIDKKTKYKLDNVFALRGNAIPFVINGVPDNSLDTILMLYPPPFPRNNHRKQRWYLHPLMDHFVRVLKPGGKILWCSDQAFYIEECRYISEKKHGLVTRYYGEATPQDWNYLGNFPKGRTTFEEHFFAKGQKAHELLSEKPAPSTPTG